MDWSSVRVDLIRGGEQMVHHRVVDVLDLLRAPKSTSGYPWTIRMFVDISSFAGG